jgi:hypothetical protein
MSRVRKPKLHDKVEAAMGVPPNEWTLTGRVTLLLAAQFLLDDGDRARLVMYDGDWTHA